MAGRLIGRALLGCGLLVVTLLGGAGGYGLGLWTTESSANAGTAGPLAAGRTSTPTPTPKPAKTAKPDDSPALDADDLHYKTRQFTTEQVVRSQVTVKVPGNWWMTQPDPKKEARFTDPTAKRSIRIEAGFTIRRPPEASMLERVAVLNGLPAEQAIKLVSQKVDESGRTATLVYTWIPEETLRYVVVQWSALDETGNAAVEMIVSGLPQDKPALWDVLDRATESVTRKDSPLQG